MSIHYWFALSCDLHLLTFQCNPEQKVLTDTKNFVREGREERGVKVKCILSSRVPQQQGHSYLKSETTELWNDLSSNEMRRSMQNTQTAQKKTK